MKTIFSLSIILFILLILSCSKEKNEPNRAPEKFTVTPTLQSDNKTIILTWTEAKDPDGDAVTYDIELDSKVLATNLTTTTFSITGLDSDFSKSGKVIAKDNKGLKTEANYNAITNGNRPPNTFVITPTLQSDNKSITLTWTEAKDPDGHTVTYDVELDGKVLASNLTVFTYTIKDLDTDFSKEGKIIAKDSKGLKTEVVYTAKTNPNRPPNTFVVTPTLQTDNKTIELTWTEAKDADGHTVTYDVELDGKIIANNLTALKFTITSLDYDMNKDGNVIAKDSKGAKTTIPFKAVTLPDATPPIGSAVRVGNGGNDEGSGVAVDNKGNVYAIIETEVTTPYYRGNTTLVKYDPNLNIIWTKRFENANAHGICIDGNSNVCVAGTFYDNANFGGASLSSVGSNDVFVAKYSSDGDLKWVRREGTSEYESGESISVDVNNNLYVAGLWNGDPNFFIGNTFVMKYNADGQLVFNWSNLSSRESGPGVKSFGDSNGNVYVVGEFYKDMKIGGITLERPKESSSYGCYMVKLNGNGKVIWTKVWKDLLYDAISDNKGNFYIVGDVIQKMSIDNFNLKANGVTDVYTMKINENGNIAWINQIGGEAMFDGRGGRGITIDGSSNVYITGFLVAKTIDFNGTILNREGYMSSFVAKYSASGKPVWIQQMVGSGSVGVGKIGASLVSQRVYVTGDFSQTAKIGISTINSEGGEDGFVALFKPQNSLRQRARIK